MSDRSILGLELRPNFSQKCQNYIFQRFVIDQKFSLYTKLYFLKIAALAFVPHQSSILKSLSYTLISKQLNSVYQLQFKTFKQV